MKMILGFIFYFFMISSAFAEPAYLYIFLHDDNSNGERFRTEFPSMETCLAALSASKTPEQKAVGGDYEVAVVMWCGGKDFERNYNGTWWKDDSKNTTSVQQ